MNVEEALSFLDTVLQKKFLNNLQEIVFRQAWAGQTYPEMAESSGYDANYIKDVGSKLWKLLSEVFEEEVTKSNFRSVLRRQYFSSQHAWRLRNIFVCEAFPKRGRKIAVKGTTANTRSLGRSG